MDHHKNQFLENLFTPLLLIIYNFKINNMETKYFSEFEPIEVSVENQVVYGDIDQGFIY